MSEPFKPITKAEREREERLYSLLSFHYNLTIDKNLSDPGIVIRRLQEAEKFFREALRDLDNNTNEGDCVFCWNHIVRYQYEDGRRDKAPVVDHKPDCSWLLAQYSR